MRQLLVRQPTSLILRAALHSVDCLSIWVSDRRNCFRLQIGAQYAKGRRFEASPLLTPIAVASSSFAIGLATLASTSSTLGAHPVALPTRLEHRSVPPFSQYFQSQCSTALQEFIRGRITMAALRATIVLS